MANLYDAINAAEILITAGAGIRIMILVFQMVTCDETEVARKKERIKNTLLFFIIALCCTSLTAIIKNYYPI